MVESTSAETSFVCTLLSLFRFCHRSWCRHFAFHIFHGTLSRRLLLFYVRIVGNSYGWYCCRWYSFGLSHSRHFYCHLYRCCRSACLPFFSSTIRSFWFSSPCNFHLTQWHTNCKTLPPTFFFYLGCRFFSFFFFSNVPQCCLLTFKVLPPCIRMYCVLCIFLGISVYSCFWPSFYFLSNAISIFLLFGKCFSSKMALVMAWPHWEKMPNVMHLVFSQIIKAKNFTLSLLGCRVALN